jgi:hypothetical protein
MVHFGFASSLLKKPTFWETLLPDKLLYYRGPLNVGPITGFLPGGDVQGVGWQLPKDFKEVWSNYRLVRLWQRFLAELSQYGIKVIGLDSATTFAPPKSLRVDIPFPGVSDGKALEMLLFVNRFRNILRNFDIPPLKAKATIVWEEGNLGVTCARLIAREVRFLNLVSSNEHSLERAAELVFAETGISAQTYRTLPEDFRGNRILIKCGTLCDLKLTRARQAKKMIWCEIFQKSPSLTSFNANLPLTVKGKFGGLPLYPALSEAILRSRFNLIDGFWYGSELPLERVVKLALCCRELGREFIV